MKTLNKITLNDILSGGAVNCKYKGFIILYHNGNVSIYFKTKYINGFIVTSKNISEIKTRITREVKKHDIKCLLKMSLDDLNSFLSSSEIEKIYSYCRISNDKNIEHKQINKYLLHEIKEYFIFRLVKQ